LAGPVPRALAFVIDLLIRGVVYVVVAALVGQLKGTGTGIMMIVAFLLEWFYPVFFEVWGNGATPGKRSFGLVVLNDTGTPVGFGASVTRNLLRAVDFLPFLYAFGLIAMLLNRDFKRLGDLAAGTIVVYRDKAAVRGVLPDARPVAPAATLTLAEKRAVLDFAERYATLTEERADELAAHAAPLVRSSRQPAQVLLGIAHYQRGKTA
ncbi:MAG: RDD family protein, partial [Burkholderiales bacterium]